MYDVFDSPYGDSSCDYNLNKYFELIRESILLKIEQKITKDHADQFLDFLQSSISLGVDESEYFIDLLNLSQKDIAVLLDDKNKFYEIVNNVYDYYDEAYA